MNAHTVPGLLVLELIHLVQRWDVTADALLAASGLRREELMDETLRVPVDVYLDLVRVARTLTGEPGLGFCMGLNARVSAFGHFGFLAMSAPTIREAIELCVQFEPMITTALGLRLRVEGKVASLVFEERADLGDVRDVIVIACLASFWNVAVALTGKDLNGAADMGIPRPRYHERFAHLVPETHYDQPTTRIVMPVQALDVPLLMADPLGQRLARERCEKALDSLSGGGRLILQVRQSIRNADGEARSVEDLARQVGMSSRTLRRQLRFHGYSLASLYDEERRDRALILLRSQTLPVEEVADRLGYSSSQNFSRAFRRWTGTTPGAYRRSVAR